MMDLDLIVIGAGPAGLAAALEARKSGVERIVILERDQEAGGILQQCIHNGFGLHLFGEELTGPEYAHRFIKAAQEAGIEIKLNTMVLSLARVEVKGSDCPACASNISKSKLNSESHVYSPNNMIACANINMRNAAAVNPNHLVTCVNSTDGLITYRTKAVVLAMGCRERSRGALNIPGSRPAGIFTAGAAQRFVNMEGYMPGNRVVILGSGDIGLIMARRLTLEGAKVLMVCEIMPYSSGLNRNIVQCLEDYDIPLKLSHTVVQIHGKYRVEAVTISKVDENCKPIPETFETIPCDTLLLSVGLIPENELSMEAGIQIDPATGGPVVNALRETSAAGIFACGNVVHVHDLVDFVSEEGRLAGEGAARYITGISSCDANIEIKSGKGVRYVVPQRIPSECLQGPMTLFFRVDAPYEHCRLILKADGQMLETRQRPKMTPGEMEHYVIGQNLIDRLKSAHTLMIEVMNGEA